MASNPDFNKQLRTQTAAVRFRQDKFGVRRALTATQQKAAADTFRAETAAIHATKQLLDTKAPEFKAVTQVISRARSYWMAVTVPYPEDGIRLIRRDRIDGPDGFNKTMEGFVAELEEAKKGLRTAYTRLRNEAQKRLGELFNADDYPPTIDDEFEIAWDFVSLAAPEFLKKLNPALYDAEQKKLAARFDEAIRMAEEAFTGELANLVGHLVERLQPSDDGKPKVFRDAAVENLTEFFSRFKQMTSGSNKELDKLVEDAQKVVSGLTPADLRKDVTVRDRVSGALAPILGVLDGLVTTKPKRKISFEGVSGEGRVGSESQPQEAAAPLPAADPDEVPWAVPAEQTSDISKTSEVSDITYDTSDSQELEESEAA